MFRLALLFRINAMPYHICYLCPMKTHFEIHHPMTQFQENRTQMTVFYISVSPNSLGLRVLDPHKCHNVV